MDDSLTIPLFVKSFDNISLNICIINNYAKGITDYANEHWKCIPHMKETIIVYTYLGATVRAWLAQCFGKVLKKLDCELETKKCVADAIFLSGSWASCSNSVVDVLCCD